MADIKFNTVAARRIQNSLDRFILLAPTRKRISLFKKDFDLLLSTLPETDQLFCKNRLFYREGEIVKHNE